MAVQRAADQSEGHVSATPMSPTIKCTPGNTVPRSFASDLKLIAFCVFYLLANFVVFYVPAISYFAWHGSLVCRALVVLFIADYCVPLRLGRRGIWIEWSKWTNFSKGLRSYFDAELIVEGTWKRDKNHLLMYHPHSLFGIAYTLVTRYFYDVYGTVFLFTGADIIAYLPLLRRIMCWWGFTSVSAPAMKANLRQAYPYNALMLQVGGIAEMFYGIDCEQIILRRRLGFCKLALQTGCCLVPCYVFGANEVYTRLAGPSSMLARISSVMRTSLVVWYGRWGIPFGVVPHPVKMVIAVGEPIEVPLVEKPTSAQIEAVHAQYVTAIQSLFDRHKHRMGAEWVAKRGAKLYLEDERPPPAAGFRLTKKMD